MADQPEALLQRLERLGQDSVGSYGMPICAEAAIELRRLHEVNAELLKALNNIEVSTYDAMTAALARAAVAKAEGQK